uniref:Uncharacterized protein n=1 Tax=Propithecus coquereli TaxID=379532 RepID=A0A2K6F410_PROCO
MAAAALTAWLGLQPGARTLRAFSTSVSPATRSLPERTSRTERLSKRKALPPRTEKMAVDQDWPSVYPAAAPFKPSAVPLPVRMGYPVKKGVPMAKEGNLELLKKTEEWEKNKTEADMEEYVWKNSSSEKNILETLLQIKAAEKKTDVNKEELLGTKEVEDYRNCVVTLKNEGENENTLSQYKESVKRLLNLT